MSNYQLSFDLSLKLKLWEIEKDDSPSCFHRTTELIYVISGELCATVNNIEYTVSDNEILFIPGLITHSCYKKPGTKTICILIPDYLLEDFSFKFEKNNLPPLLNDTEFNKKIFPLINNFYLNPNGTYGTAISNADFFIEKGYVNILVGKLLSHYPMIEYSTSSEEPIINALRYININFNRDITLDMVAENLNLNKFYLSKLFNKHVSINFRSYLNLLRIQHIHNQLHSDSKKDINQLIDECGYKTLSTYYRALKSVESITDNFNQDIFIN